ncbi:MAG: type II toxin-antitoxin system HicB family antitoxin [Coriobacteriaceae bacterium]|nr:type II toxin-antitoxin system HicB family antitoxin [Coriobacteriaceae bacterium]
MSRYIYEVVLTPDEDQPGFFNVTVPELDGCYTFGDGMTEALNMADDALKTFVAALLKFGDPIPEPTFGHKAPEGGMVIALSFETDASYIVDEVSPSEAAEMLGVSRPRVSHLIRDGILNAQKVAGETRITIDSIEAYLASPRKPGRPSKVSQEA